MKNPARISSAKVILLVSFCYYMLVGMFTTTSYATYTGDFEVIQRAHMKYFICEQSGHDVNNPCDRSGLENISVNFSAVGYVLLILYPFVHLVYVLNIKRLRRKCKSCCCCTHTLKGRHMSRDDLHDPVTSRSSNSNTNL